MLNVNGILYCDACGVDIHNLYQSSTKYRHRLRFYDFDNKGGWIYQCPHCLTLHTLPLNGPEKAPETTDAAKDTSPRQLALF